jgi:2,4-dienoyl-CoA reductase-like NADH-dependent reductase (Old Yellow Enzyme family)
MCELEKEVQVSKLFQETRIRGMRLSNRFVRSATWEGMAADDGAVTPALRELVSGLAQGGVGLIVTSHAYVRPEGQAGVWQLGIYEDTLVDGLRQMSRDVHERRGRIVCQLAHAGFFANRKLTGRPVLAPTSVVEAFGKSPRQEMTISDIQETVGAFGEAARRAKEAEFDGVQIHAAHGYLLSQFLSPAFNKRTDRYGGSAENRARALLEVYGSVRRAVGSDFPVLVKMNSADFVEGGLELQDSLVFGSLLESEGIDAIELSGGTVVSGKLSPSRTGITSTDREGYFREAGKAFKSKLKVPLILVGGIRSLETAEDLVETGCADYISMSRPFIREPDLIKRWQSGDRGKARCISDNQCFGPAVSGDGIYCVVEEKGDR